MDIKDGFRAYSARRTLLHEQANDSRNEPEVRTKWALSLNAFDLAAATYADLVPALYRRMKNTEEALPQLSIASVPMITATDAAALDEETRTALKMMALTAEAIGVQTEKLAIRARALNSDLIAQIQRRALESWYRLSTASNIDAYRGAILLLGKAVLLKVVDPLDVLGFIDAIQKGFERERETANAANDFFAARNLEIQSAMTWSMLTEEVLDVVNGEPPDPTYERASTRASERLRALAQGTWVQSLV